MLNELNIQMSLKCGDAGRQQHVCIKYFVGYGSRYGQHSFSKNLLVSLLPLKNDKYFTQNLDGFEVKEISLYIEQHLAGLHNTVTIL